jgi:phytol kinase
MQAGGIGLVFGALCSAWVSELRRRGLRVAYTRKLFHFSVFSGAAVIHALWGLPGTNTYGAVVALIVLVAVARGEGDGFYEALARDSDRPRRSLFVVVPLITTAVGGLVSGLVAGPYASVGYLAAGWGDAAAEPVGARWGRHPYRVPSFAGVRAERTLEGSLAVLLVGWMAATLALIGLGQPPDLQMVIASLACANVGAAVEAISHHGTDNLTVQISVSLTAMWLVG